MVESEAAWKPDPLGRYTYRWWSGTAWTDQVHSGAGESLVDPMGLRPGPMVPGSALPAASQAGSTSLASTGWSPLDGGAPQSASGPTVGPGYNPGFGANPAYNSGYGANPGYQYPPGQYGQMPPQLVVTEATKSPGIAVASLVLGVCSLCVALIPFFGLLSLPFSLVGLVLGIVGLSKAKKGFEGHGMAVAGVVTSGLALIIPFLWLLVFAVAFDDGLSSLDDINSDVSDGICDDSRILQDPDC